LFTQCDISSLCYDVFELVKSHHVSFPLTLNKSKISFMPIHSDVWGSSKA